MRVAIVAALVMGGTLAACAPTTLDESEMPRIMEMREDSLRMWGEIQGVPADTPIPELIRWVSFTESSADHVECLQEAGFEAELFDDGGMSFNANTEDEARALPKALWICRAKYSVDPRSEQPLTDEQVRILYDYSTQVTGGCLVTHGIDVEPAPSFDDYLEIFHGKRLPLWDPWVYVSLSDIGQAKWEQLEALCPNQVPNLYGPPLPQP